MPTSHEVCACTTLGNSNIRLSRQRNNKVYIKRLTEQRQTRLAVIVSQKKSHVSHQVIFITACAQNVRLQHERKRVDAEATRQQHVQ